MPNSNRGMINTGSNVQFLLGTQDALAKYIAGTTKATNGTFYLTQDTHRLYVGNKDGYAVPVNEGVSTVASLSDLKKITSPNPGEFYYVSDSNILCVYSGSSDTHNGGWVQINSNTNTYIVGVNTEISKADNVATITQKFTEATELDSTGRVNSNLTDTFELACAGGITLAVTGDRITLTGVENKQFNVSAASAVGTVELEDTFGGKVNFKIKSSDSGFLDIQKDADGSLLLVPADQTNTEIKVVNKANDGEGFEIKVSDAFGTKSGDFNPAIKIGSAEGEKVTVKFKNGTAELPVYTKKEIDDLHLKFNAMTYRGLVGPNADTNAGVLDWDNVREHNGVNVSVGDTFLFNADTTWGQSPNEVKVTKGTLAIAKVVEDANGNITGVIDWDFVESTTDTDTTYKLDLNEDHVRLRQHQGGKDSTVGRFTVADGTEIISTLSSTTDADGNATVTIKLDHAEHKAVKTGVEITQDKATKATDGAAYSVTPITVVESVETNDQGHVIAVKTNTVKLLDTNATVNAASVSAKAVTGDANSAKKTATFTNSIQLATGAGIAQNAFTNDWTIASSTLVFTKDANSVMNVDLVWGTF